MRATAKSALDDIRSMIGVLRCGDDTAETSPTSGTERLDDLVAYLRDAGLEATLDAEGYRRADVPAHVDMALFGIAREAATNIVRHANAHAASIRLAVEDGRARLTVEDDGKGCGMAASGQPNGALRRRPTAGAMALPAWPSACTFWAARSRRAIERAAASAWWRACP